MAMAKKKKTGRPPLQRGKESVNITFRVSPRDSRRMRKEAKAEGISLSDWLRDKTA